MHIGRQMQHLELSLVNATMQLSSTIPAVDCPVGKEVTFLFAIGYYIFAH